MHESTDRLALPLLAAGQAQKELTHNEAVVRLDALVMAAIESVGLSEPPPAPVAGQCWIVGTAPVGAWQGQAGSIACWTSGGWRFTAAHDGMVAWSRADAMDVRFVDGEWHKGKLSGHTITLDGKTVVRNRQAAIAAPSGGAVVDQEARASITSILLALRQHGLIET